MMGSKGVTSNWRCFKRGRKTCAVLGNGASQPIGTPSAKLSWPTESTSWSGSPKQCRDCEIKSGTCRASSGSGRRFAISVRALCNECTSRERRCFNPTCSKPERMCPRVFNLRANSLTQDLTDAEAMLTLSWGRQLLTCLRSPPARRT